MIGVDAAVARIVAAFAPVESGSVPIGAAQGRVLAADAIAVLAQPPFRTSAMDGYALRADDAPPLRVIGTSAAGHPFSGRLGPGETIPPGVSIAWIPLSAQLFDAGGMCPDTVVPTTWSVSIGGTVMLVPNGDGALPASAADNASGAFGACAGRIFDPSSEMISLLS